MKFTLSTKPLAKALDLAVPANVSPNYKIGTLAQLTVEGKELRINFQSKGILSEVRFKGAPETPDMKETVFVDNNVLKQLVSSFDTNTVQIDYVEGGIQLTAGKSNFLLPKLSYAEEITISRPDESKYTADVAKLNTDAWKYVKNNQAHLLAVSFEFPVYTMIHVSDKGDVLSGDFQDSMFSHSSKSDLGQTCLISSEITDLLASIPENATFKRNESNYLIQVNGEGYQYVSEVSPKHEFDSDMGDYNAEILLNELEHPDHFVSISPDALRKVLNQSALLESVKDDTMDITFDKSSINIKNASINCDIPSEGGENITTGVTCKIATKNLKKILKPYVKEKVNIAMLFEGDEAKGLLLFDDDVTIIVGGVD